MLGILVLAYALNFIGLGFGPLSIGVASDLLESALGEQALRSARIAGSILFNLGAAVLFMLAARTLVEDLGSAPS